MTIGYGEIVERATEVAVSAPELEALGYTVTACQWRDGTIDGYTITGKRGAVYQLWLQRLCWGNRFWVSREKGSVIPTKGAGQHGAVQQLWCQHVRWEDRLWVSRAKGPLVPTKVAGYAYFKIDDDGAIRPTGRYGE